MTQVVKPIQAASDARVRRGDDASFGYIVQTTLVFFFLFFFLLCIEIRTKHAMVVCTVQSGADVNMSNGYI